MIEKNAAELLRKYNVGQCSEEEKAIVESWFIAHSGSIEDHLQQADHHLAKQRIWTAIELQNAKITKSVPLWKRLIAAAAVVAVVFGTGLWYFTGTEQGDHSQGQLSNDILPGKQGATLTLASGKKISLAVASHQELAREAGVIITKTSDGRLVYQVSGQSQASSNKINTLSTANGETYRVRLPDGTLVWLNAESSISYPASFAGLKERTVQLKGEAYWEVAKDKAHPFIVKTGRQDIKVLGTHFNVYAYDGEPVKTALAEGSVQVSVGPLAKRIVPGQQTVVAGNEIKVEQADLEETLAWKDGDFNFDDERIEAIMNTLAKWYDIEVQYRNAPDQARFVGKISRSKNISQVLRMLEKTKQVHFKIEGRRVTVMP